MAAQAAMDILTGKAGLEPQVALAITEAIYIIMIQAQIVTIPVLDNRLAELRGEIKSDVTRLETKIDATAATLDKKIDATAATLEKKIDVTAATLDKKIEVTAATLDKKIEVTAATLEKKIEVSTASLAQKIEGTKAELMRWILLAMLGSGAIQAAAAAFVNAVQRH